MIYAYIRVSTDKQTVENQRFEINRFAKQRDFQIDVWVEETVSGTRSAKDRKLGVLLKRIKKGDTLIVSEISRLGRRLMEVMSILNACMLKNVILLTVKEKYELGNNIQSQILAFAFSLSAQIERDLISQRTREGLARRIASGQKLGRPMGGQYVGVGRDTPYGLVLRNHYWMGDTLPLPAEQVEKMFPLEMGLGVMNHDLNEFHILNKVMPSYYLRDRWEELGAPEPYAKSKPLAKNMTPRILA